MSVLSSITGPAITGTISAAQPTAGSSSDEFGSLLKTAISSVDRPQQQASQAVGQFLQGNGDLHNVALATQKAELSFDLAMQVRNKVLSAYQEIMKMQL